MATQNKPVPARLVTLCGCTKMVALPGFRPEVRVPIRLTPERPLSEDPEATDVSYTIRRFAVYAEMADGTFEYREVADAQA